MSDRELTKDASEARIRRRSRSAFREKGQYLLAFGVIASMLLVVGFPTFVIFFFGVFAYFLWKIFSSGPRSEIREIFEFYLSANDVLREDERRWFGFEMKEVVGRGENIVKNMVGAPPLVYFALGALYNKIGDHNAAITNLSYVVENESSDERAMVYPSPELRNYVRILRKIEREPAEAPLTSSAVRALERARRNRARLLLENSREMVRISSAQSAATEAAPMENDSFANLLNAPPEAAQRPSRANGPSTDHPCEGSQDNNSPFTDRKSISEVLHDIYDGNVQ
jgi:hypothetical protein